MLIVRVIVRVIIRICHCFGWHISSNLTCFARVVTAIITIAAELPFWGGGGGGGGGFHALLLPSFLDLALPTLLFALSFDLFALPFGFSEIYLLSTVFYCAFSQIIPRKVYLGLAKKAMTFFFFFFFLLVAVYPTVYVSIF